MHAMRLCACMLLLSVASASVLSESNSGELIETLCLTHRGSQLSCFQLDGQLIVEPYIAFQVPEQATIHEDPLTNGFYFVAPLAITSNLTFPEQVSSIWHVLRVTGFHVQLRQGTCLTECPKVSVSGEWTNGGVPLVRFHCSNRSTCLRMLWTLRFSDAEGIRLRASLRFQFFGQANDRRYTLTRIGLPTASPITQNFANQAFWFEPGKILLFNIAANSGFEATTTILNSAIQHPVPTGGVIPTLFRSGLIDQMSQLFDVTGMQYVVAEMRARGRMVAQVVFDISVRRSELNKDSWFARNRVVSSHPYPIGDAGLGSKPGSQFSLSGDDRMPDHSLRRRFLMVFEYGGCPNDIVFWTVNEVRDTCEWANKNWNGLSPSLVYSSGPMITGGPKKYEYDADQFLVYLM